MGARAFVDRIMFKISLFALLGLTAQVVHAESPGTQSAQSFHAQVTLEVGYSYLLALPEGYEADGNKKWPLVVFLHGSGERGSNLEVLKKHGPPQLIAAGQKIPAIVISPQCPLGAIWSPHGVHALTESVMKSHRVDPDRVYLTGLSMGGFGTWETAMEYPETYAALMPICGGAGVRFVMAEKIRHIPEWIFHGEKDPVVEPAFSKRMLDVLKKLGADVKLTLYPEAQHDSWTVTYDNPKVWAWLFQQKRQPAKAQ
jgi:predicted peptidase